MGWSTVARLRTARYRGREQGHEGSPATARRGALTAAGALFLAGCAGPLASRQSGSAPLQPLPAGLATADFVLLGEVHDNEAGHALRLRWLQGLVSQRRVAVVMEQFDIPGQAGLELARARIAAGGVPIGGEALRAAARELAEAGGFAFDAWRWSVYEPVVMLALEHQLPLLAANTPRRLLAAAEQPSPPRHWTAADDEILAQAIRDGHCGLLPAAAVSAMAGMQRVRDAAMAAALVAAHRESGLPVVLLAGNGHVRADIGVPRYLASQCPEAAILAVGIGERGRPLPGRFDARAEVPSAAREDPCQALRRRFGRRG